MVVRLLVDAPLEDLFADLRRAGSSMPLDLVSGEIVRGVADRARRRRNVGAIACAALLMGVAAGVVPVGAARIDAAAASESPLALAPSTLLGT